MLTSAALRGLLDATPSAIACFDATLRTVYANTAFTTVTGVQGGRPLEEETLAEAVRELLAGTGAPRRVRLGGRGRMPVSGTLFRLDEELIGMVLDAGAHEALAALAAEQSALRRVATLVADEPRAGGGVHGRGRGGRPAAARALGGHDPLRGRLRGHRRAVGGRRPRRLRDRHRRCRWRAARG